MKSYRQYCGLARALDVVGDRWALLIVRELLIRGSARYTDLLDGLPGIASNLLASRLKEMERAGLIERSEAPRPVSATVFNLTPRGAELEGVIAALGRWASPLMGQPRKDDRVQGHWFVLPVRLYLRDAAPSKPRTTVQIEFKDEPVVLQTAGDGTIAANPGRDSAPDATLWGDPTVVMGLLGKRLTLAQARARGLRLEGNAKALDRMMTKAA